MHAFSYPNVVILIFPSKCISALTVKATGYPANLRNKKQENKKIVRFKVI